MSAANPGGVESKADFVVDLADPEVLSELRPDHTGCGETGHMSVDVGIGTPKRRAGSCSDMA